MTSLLAQRAVIVAEVNSRLTSAMTALSLERSLTEVSLSMEAVAPKDFTDSIIKQRDVSSGEFEAIRKRLAGLDDQSFRGVLMHSRLGRLRSRPCVVWPMPALPCLVMPAAVMQGPSPPSLCP